MLSRGFLDLSQNSKINFFLGTILTIYIEKIGVHVHYPYITYVSFKSKVVLPTIYLKIRKICSKIKLEFVTEKYGKYFKHIGE